MSTVFLAIDHSYDGDVPVLFETMVFGGDHDQEQERYTSYEQAEAGHVEMVKKVFHIGNGVLVVWRDEELL